MSRKLDAVIDDLLKSLALQPSTDLLFNPYRDRNADDALAAASASARCHRLRTHLSRGHGGILLCGEAPSYAGARLTGVAFTSEFQLMAGEGIGLAGEKRISTRLRPWREQSAAIVHRVTRALAIMDRVVLFNAVPFHPRLVAHALSNRTPTAGELRQGAAYLEAVLAIATPAVVVAVGKSASKSLTAIGISHQRVRHPAYGGAAEFEAGLRSLI